MYVLYLHKSCTVNQSPNVLVEDLQSSISTLCRDQYGCRYLQQRLEEGRLEHINMIFREIFDQFGKLMIGAVDCFS